MRKLPPHLDVERKTKAEKRTKVRAHVITEFHIGEFHPNGEDEPTRLHFSFVVDGIKHPIVAEFSEPDTLRFLIEELVLYMRRIWPDAPMPFPLDDPELSLGDDGNIGELSPEKEELIDGDIGPPV